MTAGTAPAEARRPRRGLLFPLILIGLGALFLLGNFGYISPLSARALLQLWPVLLIVVGIEMILARREPYLALAVEILVVLAAIGLALAQPGGLWLPLSSSASAASVEREGARTLSLRLEGGGGSYTLAGGAAALVEARSEGGEIQVRTTRSGETAEVRVEPPSRLGGLITAGGLPPVDVDVRVASDVPTTVRVNVGAGTFTVDLREIQVREARIETGASKLELTLPRPSGDVPVRIQAGAASVTIIVPEDVEVRITTSGGVLSTTTLNARLGAGTSSSVARSGSSTETAGYATAKDRVTVTIQAGASSISIR